MPTVLSGALEILRGCEKRLHTKGILLAGCHGEAGGLAGAVGDQTLIAEQTLSVRTSSDELLIALDHKAERLWKCNGDHLRRWNAEHREQLQRWSEDQKYEQRPVPAFAERRAMAAAKYHRRMETTVHEIAAQLVGYTRRRKLVLIPCP